jgi:hypothetical protein
MKAIGIVLIGPFLFASCVQLTPSTGIGPNLVAGRAALTTRGYTRPCEDVVLVPVVEPVRRAIASLGSPSDHMFVREASFRPVAESQVYRDLARIVDCRPDGSFEFRGVPKGSYELVARVTWLLHWSRRGGFLIRQVEISGDRSDLQIMETKDNA